MHRHIVTLHQSGRFTVPAAIRRELGLLPGDTLAWFEQDGDIFFRKAKPHELLEVNSQAANMNEAEDKEKD